MDLQIPVPTPASASTPGRWWLPAVAAWLCLLAAVVLMAWSSGDPADASMPERASPVDAGPDYAAGAL